MLFIRSVIYDIFICIWGMLIPIIYFWALFKKKPTSADQGARNWAKFSMWGLEKICGIKYEVRGWENIPKENGFIVACKHQSMWETIVMHVLFMHPVYTWKRELLRVPFYGWYLYKMSGIPIDRKGGAKALKDLLLKSKKYLKDKRNIIIFPQGTRTKVGASTKDYPYQVGIAAIYNASHVKVIPAALNAGIYWNKSQTRKPGTVILEFLPAINPGLNKKEFLRTLEEQIESRSDALCNAAQSIK